jgi:hypothetical protein
VGPISWGVFVGASESDPTIIYTIDYRWYDDRAANDLAVRVLRRLGAMPEQLDRTRDRVRRDLEV